MAKSQHLLNVNTQWPSSLVLEAGIQCFEGKGWVHWVSTHSTLSWQHLHLRRNGVHLRALPRYSLHVVVSTETMGDVRPFRDSPLGCGNVPGKSGSRTACPGLRYLPLHPGSGLWLEPLDSLEPLQPKL